MGLKNPDIDCKILLENLDWRTKYMEKTAKIAYKALKYSLVGFSAYYLLLDCSR